MRKLLLVQCKKFSDVHKVACVDTVNYIVYLLIEGA